MIDKRHILSRTGAAVLTGFVLLTSAEPLLAEEKAEATTEGTASAGEEKEGEPKEARRKDVRMPFLTAAIQGGIVYFSPVELSGKDSTGTQQVLAVSNRMGVIFKLHLNLLGSGLAIEINPLFAHEWVGDDGLENFYGLGLQLGLAYRWQIRRFYPKIGIGGHLAYLAGGDINGGMEGFGRLPVGFSIYFVRFLAFDFEAAFLTGTTGLKTEGLGIFDDHARWDYTSGVEVVIGLRFP